MVTDISVLKAKRIKLNISIEEFSKQTNIPTKDILDIESGNKNNSFYQLYVIKINNI